MKRSILAFICFAFLLSAYSQPKDKMILCDKNKYKIDEQFYKRKEIKSLLVNNPASAKEFHKYNVQKCIGFISITGGAVTCIVAVNIGLSNMDMSWGNTSQPESNYKGFGLFCLGLGIIGAGGIVLASNPHLKNSINLYNKSLNSIGLKPVQFNLSFSPNGLGMKMTF